MGTREILNVYSQKWDLASENEGQSLMAQELFKPPKCKQHEKF